MPRRPAHWGCGKHRNLSVLALNNLAGDRLCIFHHGTAIGKMHFGVIETLFARVEVRGPGFELVALEHNFDMIGIQQWKF